MSMRNRKGVIPESLYPTALSTKNMMVTMFRTRKERAEAMRPCSIVSEVVIGRLCMNYSPPAWVSAYRITPFWMILRLISPMLDHSAVKAFATGTATT